MLDVLKASAVQQTDAVLDTKRRRHYQHAALLVACCAELEDTLSNTTASSAWTKDLRTRTARFPAFQRELDGALSRVQRAGV